MPTADNKTTAQVIAKRLGATEVEAQALPDEKSAVGTKLHKEGRAVTTAGDGVPILGGM